MLDGIDGSWKNATVRGTLHAEGWGATMGYPAIVLDKSADEVEGFLFSSDGLADHWARLDEFEAEAYERIQASVARLTAYQSANGVRCRHWVRRTTGDS